MSGLQLSHLSMSYLCCLTSHVDLYGLPYCLFQFDGVSLVMDRNNETASQTESAHQTYIPTLVELQDPLLSLNNSRTCRSVSLLT